MQVEQRFGESNCFPQWAQLAALAPIAAIASLAALAAILRESPPSSRKDDGWVLETGGDGRQSFPPIHVSVSASHKPGSQQLLVGSQAVSSPGKDPSSRFPGALFPLRENGDSAETRGEGLRIKV